MRRLLRIGGFLLLSSDVATWLRMFNPRLAMQSWPGLVGQPPGHWVGAILFYPLFELLYSWPAYVVGGALFIGIRSQIAPLTMTRATLLGTGIGAAIYCAYALPTGEWIMREHRLLSEQLIVYSLAGAFFGLCYYRFVEQHKPGLDAAVKQVV